MNILRFAITLLLVTIPVYTVHGDDTESAPKVVVPSEDGVQRIDIIVDSYSFEPKDIVVSVNKPVELNLRSVTSIISHNFTIDDPSSGLEIEENVPSGKDIKVTFTPEQTGKFKFYCGKKGIFGSHLNKGMEGTIEVVE